MSMRNIWFGCALGLVALQIAAAQKKAPEKPKSTEASAERGGGRAARREETTDKSEKSVLDYELPGADGKGVPFATYKGKVILVVNLARNSSYNEQLPALTKLSEKYQDKGLVVIGIPSNDFGAAEPGTDAEIQKFYKADNKVSFPVM